jgi:adenine specific DNA methylase Mod
MSKRLELAKSLLSKDGIIFISIDDNELAQLKMLCDEIFSENNFVSLNVVESTEDTIHIRNMKPGKEAIAKKAYEIWLQTGGNDQENWAAAEKFLLETA